VLVLLVGVILTPVVVEVPELLAAVLVKVRFSKLPVPLAATAKEASAKVLILPVVVVEVILVKPEVLVKDNAPVVIVKPLEAVNRPAEVIAPEPVVEMLLVVVIEPADQVPVVIAPVSAVITKPLYPVFPVKLSAPANVARVPEVGRVTLVAAVVVSVREFAPEVIKSAAMVRLPPRFRVREVSLRVSVKARSAVNPVA
jgi:hypothetical protein